MTITREEAVELLETMVRINSVTPWLIEGGAGEGEVARFARDWFLQLGLEVVLEEVEPDRPNVLAWLRGSSPGPTICLTAHSDTVGFAAWPDRALNPVIEGDHMIGLGVADDKGACVAAMLAAAELVRSGDQLAGNVLIALAIDEEGISIGMEHLVEHHADEIDMAINLEPDGSHTIFGEHQGFGWIDIVVGETKPADYSRYENNFKLADGETIDDVFAWYDRVAARTEKVVDDLDRPVPVDHSVPWNPQDVDNWSVRWVLLHLIQETARHTGHADIIREGVDGGTAYPLMAAAEGWPDSPWMKKWTAAG